MKIKDKDELIRKAYILSDLTGAMYQAIVNGYMAINKYEWGLMCLRDMAAEIAEGIESIEVK